MILNKLALAIANEIGSYDVLLRSYYDRLGYTYPSVNSK